MPRRNLLLVFVVLVVSIICYVRSDASSRNRHGRMFETFSRVMSEIEDRYVEEVDERDLFEGALSGMVGRLDQYSAYIPPPAYQQLQETLKQRFGGIGIQVSLEGEQRQLTVESPLYGTPAYRAGMLAGDRILEINGESTKDFTLQDAVDRLRGAPGTRVKLKVLHLAATDPVDIELERAEIKVATVLGDARAADDTWDFFLTDEDRIGYIRVTQFSESTTEELRAALDWLKQRDMQGLILDLRNNPGGLLESAVDVADLFIDEGVIVSTRGRDGVARAMYQARADGTFTDFPLVVLVNHYSASASEIVAACLQDHGRATIVGQRTWGKGSVQDVIDLEDGQSALKLTMASYWRPNGHNIHRLSDATEDDEWGVRPLPQDEVKLSDEELAKMFQARRDRDILRPRAAADPQAPLPDRHDPQLQRALEVIQQSPAKPASASA
jgi:carboxyl-terminal processing protease